VNWLVDLCFTMYWELNVSVRKVETMLSLPSAQIHRASL
jgi:hypothetical protein